MLETYNKPIFGTVILEMCHKRQYLLTLSLAVPELDTEGERSESKN